MNRVICAVITIISAGWMLLSAVGAEESVIHIQQFEPESTQNDSFALIQLSIDGDQLFAHVYYDGGCTVHEFETYWWEDFIESEWVEASLHVTHDANGDVCRSPWIETIAIDLLSLRKAYQAKFNQLHGSIRISVQGYHKRLVAPPGDEPNLSNLITSPGEKSTPITYTF